LALDVLLVVLGRLMSRVSVKPCSDLLIEAVQFTRVIRVSSILFIS
jgi:hypothetical protein